MDLDSALERALDGEAILFLGAGFSLGATSSWGKSFELGSQFASRLASSIGLSAPIDLQDAAEAFLQNRGAPALAKEVRASFFATDVGAHHLAIAKVPWRRIYTTNYDNVLEIASSKTSRSFRPVTLSDQPGDIDPNEPICVHFNGFVDRVESSIGDELKLTDSSYISGSVEASPWSSVFRLDLSMASSVFFVGYSLGDLDITRLLASTETLQEKTYFVVGSSPSPQTVNRATRYGTLQRFDSAWFGKQLEKKRERYSPRESTHPSWYCVKPYETMLTDTTAVSDRAVFDLFLRGSVDRQLAWNSIHGSVQPYLIQRTCVDRIMGILDDASNLVVVHGHLGNGKSMVTETVAGLAHAAGRPVYFLSRRAPSLDAELLYLCSSSKPFLLIVDTYPAWMDALSQLGRFRNEHMSLLLTARTGPNDVLFDRVEDIFRKRVVREIDVQRMDAHELDIVNDTFEKYGLWGEKAADTKRARTQFLAARCHGEWQAILVELFQAPQIEKRFAAVVKTLDQKGGYFDVLIGILALTVLSQRVTIDTLADIFGHRVLDTSFQRNDRIAEFIDFRRGEVTNRSSVAAQFVLRRVADPNLTVDVLAGMARSLDRLGTTFRIYNETLRSLLQFSQLEMILPNRSFGERRDASFRYYERVKNLNYCQTNPQFWLQYAIAALVFEDFERAERYFESAYSFAKRHHGYDTHKIDNHYARLLLGKACRSPKEIGLKLFRHARRIIFEQIQTERLHYPYRVATGLGEFFDTFAGSFSTVERQEVVSAAGFVENKIKALPSQLQQQYNVVECLATMVRIRSLVK